MSAFVPIPLGRSIPDTPHAVSCSLPTMRAVRGYEEKNPEITRHLTSGYPRFVLHPFLRQLAELCQKQYGLPDRSLWLTSSARMSGVLAVHLRQAGMNPPPTVFDLDGLHGVSFPQDPVWDGAAKLFLQNVGGFMSSRAAEDRLALLKSPGAFRRPAPPPGDSTAIVRRHLQPLFAGAAPEDILLAGSGTNAVYAAFRTLARQQAAQGRTAWIQLGWLYLDTIALLKRFAARPDDYIHVPDVFDLAALEQLFAARGHEIAGVIVECPTNPLIQTPDLPALAQLAWRHGAAVIADPSIASAYAVDVLPHADLVALSLTKYTASEGDVIAGAVVVNPARPNASLLRDQLPEFLEPVYPRDLARLAEEIPATPAVLAQIHASVPRIVAWLEAHPAVKQVFWARHPASDRNYARLVRSPGAVGGMISFTVRPPLDQFYDRLRLPKGPSFGMTTTLLCPFLYLAHYELVTTAAGRAELGANGLDPDLLRLSVGCEPADDIIAALAEALA